MSKTNWYFFLLSCLLLCSTHLSFAQPAVPEPTDYLVNDYARLMSQQQVNQLGNKLRDYALETSTQIVIFTETSLEGGDDFERALDIYEEWKIGGSEVNSNGALIYIAQEDRKIRIMTGYGAEGFLTDAMSRRIIDNIIAPAFRNGNYYQGLDKATDAIMDLGQGEYTAEDGNRKRDAKGGVPAILVILFIILIIIIASRMGGDDDDDDGGYYRGGRYDMDPHRKHRRRRGGGWIFLPGGGGLSGGGSSGGGGGGFGGLGGGGFGGFGGGLTGGGGAGGSW